MRTTKAPIQVDDGMLTTSDGVIITLIHSTTDKKGIKMRHNDFSAFQFLVNLAYPTSAHIRSGKHNSVFNFTTFEIGRFPASIKLLLTLCINNISFFFVAIKWIKTVRYHDFNKDEKSYERK